MKNLFALLLILLAAPSLSLAYTDMVMIDDVEATEQPQVKENDEANPSDSSEETEAPDQSTQDTVAAETSSSSSSASKTSSSSSSSSKSDTASYEAIIKDAKKIEGMIDLYQKGSKLYAKLKPTDLNSDLIVLISIARGMGKRPLLGGMSWGFGEDWIWQFRKSDDRILIVRRNLRFRADKGTPQAESVRTAYNDSVIFSLPISATVPGGGYMVDLSPVFKSDLPEIGDFLKGFTFSRDKSTWASVKGFKKNIEIEVAATYASSNSEVYDSVADSRGVTLNVHYSISKLPSTGYLARLADDRVGYFMTVIKDYSKTNGNDRFVRYINRWNLMKADPSAKVSPPRKPIIFWIEKTVPYKYRQAVREGILEWNKAFEAVGICDAIEVRQQPEDADWDPEDINYNTFRWITSSAAMAMGPSRVNPINGEILDADIIFDADFLEFWQDEYNFLGIGGEPAEPEENDDETEMRFGRLAPDNDYFHQDFYRIESDFAQHMSRQFAFGSIATRAMASRAAEGRSKQWKEKLERIQLEAVRSTVTHEVGHTLGLRHNFKGSTYLTFKELDDPEREDQGCISGSIMDYLPINVAPEGKHQGAYFPTSLGPYDLWAIEYGYRPSLSGEERDKIASRGSEIGLQYATDEDCRPGDPDPLANTYDLGANPIEFSERRAQIIAATIPKLVDLTTIEGEDYSQVRSGFNSLLFEHRQAMEFAARFIGGVYLYRDHAGDPGKRPPQQIVPRQLQVEALSLLQREVFAEDAYQFPPELYQYMGQSNWSHWGVTRQIRIDYPVSAVIANCHNQMLSQLLSSTTLSRLIDSAAKNTYPDPAFTVGELFERLTRSIFSELDKLGGKKQRKYTDSSPAISPIRRMLQEEYYVRMANIAIGRAPAPRDSRALARLELIMLADKIGKALSAKSKLDRTSLAHLTELKFRISRVLESDIESTIP